MPRWFLNSLEYQHLCIGYRVIITTDVVCHLWLRWSYNPPQKHPRVKVVRGLRLMGDVYYCFTAYRDIEQDEAGDTTTHTFTITAWQEGDTRHFYFHGTIGGIVSPSESPIVSHTRPEVSIHLLGSPAIPRPGNAGHAINKTIYIEGSNPSPASGIVCKVKIWVNFTTGNPIRTGTFYQVAPNTFTLRDSSLGWLVNVGYNERAESLIIEEGDFFGVWLMQGVFIGYDLTGGVGIWRVVHHDIFIDNQLCVFVPDLQLSLQGEMIY